MQLGEARSKCEHLAGTPLQPDVARELYKVTLIKGAQATTAIEGNTLTVDQVAGIYEGSFEAPSSRRYQEIEVRKRHRRAEGHRRTGRAPESGPV